MKITRFCCVLTLVFVLLLMPVSSFAGDFAELNFIGFSKDGRYLAFEEYGGYDGSGGDYSSTYYIDTVKNTYALPPTLIEETFESPAEENKQKILNKKLALVKANNLRRLGIIKNNTGDLLVAHLRTDWTSGVFLEPRGAEAEIVRFNNYVLAYSRDDSIYYELTLKPSLFKTEACGEEALKFDLTLEDRTYNKNLPLQILQSDKIIPEKRNCPFGYRIERVYFYGDKTAVFLNYFYQGFEGPDLRYLVVTGKLNQPTD
jgi:predicted secreted protein